MGFWVLLTFVLGFLTGVGFWAVFRYESEPAQPWPLLTNPAGVDLTMEELLHAIEHEHQEYISTILDEFKNEHELRR
jgi:hypothetical protein